MRNNIQKLNPAQVLPAKDGLDLHTSRFYHENIAQKKHNKWTMRPKPLKFEKLMIKQEQKKVIGED